MAIITLNKKDEIMMSLAHYFIIKENYSPINVQGAKDEIWLENLEGPYRVIRITNNSIINEEQYRFDVVRMQLVLRQIKRKTLSFKINALNICLNLDEKLNISGIKNINTINVSSMGEAKTNEALNSAFPYLKDELIESNNSLDLIVNVTNDINKKTEIENKKYEKVFSPKKIVITNIIISLCIIIFLLMYLLGNGSTDNETLLLFGANFGPLVKSGEVWRLISCAFIHIGFAHLLVNMYSLFIIGSQVETFIGKWKFLLIYIISAIGGSLMSLCFKNEVISAGASGAIFGLLGSLLYFGYHYRLYLNNALKTQIIPIIIINLLIGFMSKGIDNGAHIGGLVAGYLSTMALGLEGKSEKKDIINGWISLILYFLILIVAVFYPETIKNLFHI